MNLLITGGCGFIGSNFINFIFDKININKLVNLDAMYYCASKDYIDKDIQNHNDYIFIKGNTRNADLINYILQTHKITDIINFAAQSHVCNSFSNPIQYTKDNIFGTHILLDCCYKYHISENTHKDQSKHNKIHKFIHISTDEVYGESQISDNKSQKKTETSVLCPTNPYSATKAGAELIVQSYYHSFDFPIIITRSNNIYGKNQYHEKLIPKFIKLLKKNKTLTIHGNGETIRSFLHVDDLCEAFKLILTKGVIGEIYNIGSEDEYTVLEIVRILVKKIKNTDETEKYIEYVKDRPFNDKRYWITDNKIKNLGWKIKKQFSQELDILIE
jgi:UDP-glucose 4,6-dehydratase